MKLEKIVKIEKMDIVQDTIDIELDGDHLFFANDILTHNSGANNVDISLKDVGDSHGLSKTADLIIAFTRIDNDETMKNKLFFRQLKNRYNSISYYEKFLIGVDYPKMRIYEIEEDVQDVMLESEDRKEEDIRILKKQVGSLTIDDWKSGNKYKGMFSEINFSS